MTSSHKTFLSVVVLTFLISIIKADNYYFEQISLNEGLSQSSVKCIYRDRVGLLWIGTKEGLNRYDGRSIRTYYHDANNPNSIPNNNIFFITEDDTGELWIGTEGTLCRYQRSSDSFVQETIHDKEISLRNIYLNQHFLYSTTGTSLLVYDCRDKTWTEKPFVGDEVNVTAASKILEWDDETLLLASSWKGLFFLNIATGKLTRTPFCQRKNILNLYRTKNGNYWISENGIGVSCYNSHGKKILDLSRTSKLYKADKIMDFVEVGDVLWMVSDGEGVLTYNFNNEKIERIDLRNKGIKKFSVNSLLTIYKDNYNNIWLGSIRSGLLSVRKMHVNVFGNVPLMQSNGLSDPTVLCFYEDDREHVWIGTDGQGLNLFEPQTATFRHFPLSFSTKVVSICPYDAHTLLLSMYKDGLFLFNKNNGRLTPLIINDSNGNRVFTNDRIGINIVSVDEHTILIADEHVYSFSTEDKTLKQVIDFAAGSGSFRFWKSVFLEDKILLFNNAIIYSYNYKTTTLEKVFHLTHPEHVQLNAIDIDQNGDFWLGTNIGLFKYSSATSALEHIQQQQIKSVSVLQVDTKGSIWIGSGIALYRYNIFYRQLFKYGKSDGIIPNEYLSKSRLLAQSGEVFLGGVSGMIQIERDIPFHVDVIPNIELLDVQLDGSQLSISPMKNDIKNRQIVLPWKHTSLRLNLFINTPSLAAFPRCRFKIQGFNTAYQNLENQTIQLSTLPHGNYKILIAYELKDNQWSKDMDLVSIYVKTPWWQSWWFYMLLLVGFSGVIYRVRLSALKKMRQKIALSKQKQEQELADQKIRFLINISHELRTPLTLIYLPLQRMLKSDTISEGVRPLLTLMYKHVKTIKNMIDMILDVRKMEFANDGLRKSDHIFNAWVESVVDDFRFECKEKNIELVLILSDEVTILHFDRDRLDKVLSNLLMNAIKFSEEGGKITIKTIHHQNKIKLAVIDEGPGVPAEDVSKLFTRFYQSSNRKGGSGIGLSYAKTQIELHGGTIGYTSATPCGSEFWFEIPIEDGEIAIPENYSQTIFRQDNLAISGDYDVTDDSATWILDNLTVLLVEDEPDLLTWMEESLADHFKKVIKAKDGAEALKKTHEFLPDLVISDIMMPVMDGLEFCKALKSNIGISHIPVVLLTALSDKEHSLLGYKMGADIYLSKPFETDLLLAIINNLLQTRNVLKKRYSHHDNNIHIQEITFSNADEKFINQLIKKIKKKLEEVEFSIDELAAEMAMSRSSFYAKVKKITGMSVNSFIIDYKIKQAICLLHDPDLPIQEIALQVGFVNQRYFSTVFKQHTEKTPSQFREEIMRNSVRDKTY
ncbi:MAG: response regulator [Pigmentiphaga sp.]|nr:response regulator [Pigmentiphaga sp.]